MPLTKAQAKANTLIRAWLHNDPITTGTGKKAVSEVPDLDPDYIHKNYSPRNIREYAQFYTPYEVARDAWYYICGFVDPYNTIKTLDPAGGIGALLEPGETMVRLDKHYIEIDDECYAIGKKLFPRDTWYNGNAFEVAKTFEPESFDLVVSNPPFNIRCDTDDSYISTKSEYAFLELAFRLLKPGDGVGAFLCPYNFWDKRPKPLIELCDKLGVALIQSPMPLGGGFKHTGCQVSLFLFKTHCPADEL